MRAIVPPTAVPVRQTLQTMNSAWDPRKTNASVKATSGANSESAVNPCENRMYQSIVGDGLSRSPSMETCRDFTSEEEGQVVSE